MAGAHDLPTLTVVVPCWNDVTRLEQTLSRFKSLSGIHELIVGDASAAETCRDLARSHGAKVVAVTRPNRGRQMNAAAALATGEVLLFHHVDTEFDQAHVNAIRSAMADERWVGGAFYRKFDPVQHRHRQWLNPMIRRLNRRGTMFGDQSVFARRAVFEKIGGFKDMPLMEDVDFSRRLRLAGKVVLLDPPLMSSSRRHLVHGQVRTSIENFVLLWLFKFGVSPHMLHRWYYRRAAKIMSR